MRTVFLTVGPRGSGKSSFCKKVLNIYREIIFISRDAIMLEILGRSYTSWNINDYWVVMNQVWHCVEEALQATDATVILDCWNSFPDERTSMTKKLRLLGASRVDAWYFITSLPQCVEWFLQKDEIKQLCHGGHGPCSGTKKSTQEDNCRRDYQLFHSMPVDLSQGFDHVWRIDPAEFINTSMLGL